MKKIENFMLPEHTNELYTKEAISSISLTRDVAEKINELVAAYNELFEEDLLWKHEQEGRIRKGVLYMKDNLINSLNELMQLVGNSIIDERVAYYVKDLTTRVNNLLGNASDYSEVTDMRVGINQKVYKFAGDAIRDQIQGLLNLITGEDLARDLPRWRGYYSINDNGGEILYSKDGSALSGMDECFTDKIKVDPNSVYTASLLVDPQLKTGDLWISVHFYNEDGSYTGRKFTTLPDEFMQLTFETGNNHFIRISYRSYFTGRIKLEKGIFSTLNTLQPSTNNLLDTFPLYHDGFYSWGQDGLMHFFKAVNGEKSTDLIPVGDHKTMTLYYMYGQNGWAALNFITKEGYFARLNEGSDVWNGDLDHITDPAGNTVLRYVFNTTGKYTVEIPEEAYAVAFSLRTPNLEEVGLFFDDMDDQSKKYYELLFKMLSVQGAVSSADGGIPHTTTFEMKDIAHRGLSSAAPENTMSAYKKAYEAGFKYVECDVQFTADNVPVLLHDNTIDRCSNGSGSIYDLTYEQAAAFDFGSWFSSSFTGEALPKFSTFIDYCRKKQLHPYIEIKGDTTVTNEQIDQLIYIVKAHSMIKNVTWICFELKNLQHVVEVVPSARVGYTVVSLTPAIVDMAASLRTGSNEVFVDTYELTDEGLAYAIDQNMPVEMYTIDDASLIKELNPYISGVTSNSKKASEILKDM